MINIREHGGSFRGGKGNKVNGSVNGSLEEYAVAAGAIKKNDLLNNDKYNSFVQTIRYVAMTLSASPNDAYLSSYDIVHIKDSLFAVVGSGNYSGSVYAVLLDITGTTVTKLIEYVIPATSYGETVISPDKSKLIISFKSVEDNLPAIVVANIDSVNRTLSFGSVVKISTFAIPGNLTVRMMDNTHGICSYRANYLYSVLFSISGTAVTAQTPLKTSSGLVGSGVALGVIDSNTAIVITAKYNESATSYYYMLKRNGTTLNASAEYVNSYSNAAYPINNESDLRIIDEDATHYYVKMMTMGSYSLLTYEFKVPKSVDDLVLTKLSHIDRYDTSSRIDGDIKFSLNSKDSYRTYRSPDYTSTKLSSTIWHNGYPNLVYATNVTTISTGMTQNPASCAVDYNNMPRIIICQKTNNSTPMVIVLHDYTHNIAKYSALDTGNIPAIALADAKSGEKIKVMTLN